MFFYALPGPNCIPVVIRQVNRNLPARSKIQDARFKMQDPRCKIQDARCKIQDARFKMLID
jgi:hypothetical protein